MRAIMVVGVCDQACTITARGTLIVKTPTRKPRRGGGPRPKPAHMKHRAFTLRTAQARAAPGEPGRLRMRMRTRVRKAARTALLRGGHVKANITAGAADALGIPARTRSTEVVLKGKRSKGKRRCETRPRRC
jgi:hypothetical protein